MASHNQCTVCYISFINNAGVICNACFERVDLFCCDALNDLGLTDNLSANVVLIISLARFQLIYGKSVTLTMAYLLQTCKRLLFN